MKKFVLIYHGYENPTPHREAAWDTWLQRRRASFSEVGSRFGPGRRITNDTTNEFSVDTNPASGFSIVHAPNIDAAEQLLEGCPIVDSVTVYEALSTPDRQSPGPPATIINPREQEHDMSTLIDRPRPPTAAQTKIEGEFQ